MRIRFDLLILVAALAAAGCASTPPERVYHDPTTGDPLPTPAERVAEWRSRFGAEPMPAAILFRTLLSDSEAVALLEAHGLRPYAALQRVGMVGNEHRVPHEMAGRDVIAAARESAARTASLGLCSTVQRLESWFVEPPATWPQPAALAEARAMIARAEAAHTARSAVAAPLLYAVEVLGSTEDLARIAADRRVAEVQPAALVPGARDGVLVPGMEPLPAHEREIPGELERLNAQQLRERMGSVAAAVSDCEGELSRTRPPVDPGQQSDTLPLSTIPPAVFPLFSLRAAAEGTFQPGVPLEIAVRVDARARVDSVRLSITLPELAAARAADWHVGDLSRRDIGVPYPPLDDVVTGMRPETSLLLRRSVTFHAPGHYLVSLVVRALSRPVLDTPMPTVDEAFASFWIRIDEFGGAVESDFDPTRVPLNSSAQPGPLQPLRGGNPLLPDGGPGSTRASVAGDVRTADGRAVAGARVSARAYLQQCPGRGAAEAATLTDVRGGFVLELRSAHTESFMACVAVQVDPPVRSGLAAHTRELQLRFLRRAEAAAELNIVLPAEEPEADPADGLQLPEDVQPQRSAADYRAVVDAMREDVTGDGRLDTVHVSADAELDARGRPLWEDGHRWRVIVRGAAETFLLYDEFVPNGTVTARVARYEIDERNTLPAIVIEWQAPHERGGITYRFDTSRGAFVPESVHRTAVIE